MVKNGPQDGLLGLTNPEDVNEKPNLYESIHVKQMSKLLKIDPQELLKRVEPIVNNDEFLIRVFGSAEVDYIKNNLNMTKPTLDLADKELVAKTSEFQEFFQGYKVEHSRKETNILQNLQAQEAKKQLHEMELPEELQNKQNAIKQCRSIIAKFSSSKNLNSLASGRTYLEMMKKFDNDIINQENAKTIYDFIFEYKESSASKKRLKPGQSTIDFFKTNGDYVFKIIIDFVNSEEKKLGEKIAQYRKRNEGTIKKQIKIATNEDLKKSLDQHKDSDEDIMNKALDVFIKKVIIGDIKSINTNYCINKDNPDISRVKGILDGWMKQTIPALNFKDTVLGYNKDANTLMKGNRISMNKYHYGSMIDHNIAFKKWLSIQTPESIKGYIFDRYIEYVGMAITEHRIKDVIKTQNAYKGTTYRIFKTDYFDDSFGGGDFVVLFKFPGDKSQKEEIAVIDLLVSETKYKTNDDLPYTEDQTKENKIQKAAIPKYLYSTYAKLLGETSSKGIRLSPLKRIVVEENAKLVYTLLAKLMKGHVRDLGKAVDEHFEIKNIKHSTRFVDPADTNINKMIHMGHELLSDVA